MQNTQPAHPQSEAPMHYESFTTFLATKVVTLRDRQIGPHGAVSLGVALSKHDSVIEAINLSGNSVGDQGLHEVLAGLAALSGRTQQITLSLDLSGNKLGDASIPLLANFIKKYPLMHLNLSRNNIGPHGAELLADILFTNSSLTYLNLYDNFIGDSGVAAIAHSIALNESLNLLGLAMNSIGDTGCCTLAEALQINMSIQRLHLHNNRIGLPGGIKLYETLSQRRAPLISLNISRNHIPMKNLIPKVEELESTGKVIMTDIGYQSDESYQEVHEVRAQLFEQAPKQKKKFVSQPIPMQNPAFLERAPPSISILSEALVSSAELRATLVEELTLLTKTHSELTKQQDREKKKSTRCPLASLQLATTIQAKKDELQRCKQSDFTADISLANTLERANEIANITTTANSLLSKLYAIHEQLSPDVKDEGILQVLQSYVTHDSNK